MSGLILCTTDWHLTDQDEHEYRWAAFDHVHAALDAHPNVSAVFHCGDMLDRKDRFTAIFVNRFLDQLARLGRRAPTWVLKGNHDHPLSGPAFFEFVSGSVPGVRYIVSPTPVGDAILLPYCRDPETGWAGIDLGQFRAAFMHVTPRGSVGENGYQLTGSRLPRLPRGLRVYTGDVHTPQTVGRFTCVGCPHPVDFGDAFRPRMLLIDAETFEIAHELPVATIAKRVVEVSSLDDLRALDVCAGDQVRVRVGLAPDALDRWGELEAGVAAWAARVGVTVASAEYVVAAAAARPSDAEASPETILREFGAVDGVSDELMALGLDLLREATG